MSGFVYAPTPRSLTREELWGVPKPQFSTIKPVNIGGKSSHPGKDTYTGQVDVFRRPEEAQSIKESREKASQAFLQARFEKFPQKSEAEGEKVRKATDEREEAAGLKVWAKRSSDEQQRVVDAAQTADDMESLHVAMGVPGFIVHSEKPEQRKQEILKKKELYNAKKAEREAEKAKLQREPVTLDTINHFVKLGCPVKVTLKNGSSLIGKLPHSIELQTGKEAYRIDLHMMDDNPIELEINGKGQEIISIERAS